jgi:hypothetical protein
VAITAPATHPSTVAHAFDAATETAIPRARLDQIELAQRSGGEAGERGSRARQGGEAGERGHRPAAKAKSGGEAGEAGEEGGKKAGAAALPPDLDFALKIGELRGHLRVADELAQAGEWAAALPHFQHPSEEIYGSISRKLKAYKTPAFSGQLKKLVATVKAKKSGQPYADALKAVNDALAAADAGLKAKQPDWDKFVVKATLELLRSAAEEYKEAVEGGRISNTIEYQDARGFVWHAESMIDSVAPALEKRDADAVKGVRAALAEMKKAFPGAMPPAAPVKDAGAMLGDLARAELSLNKLM